MDAKVSIRLDDDVPLPPKHGGAPALRFPQLEIMDVGQSFAVEKDRERSLRSCIQFMQTKHQGRKFTVRTMSETEVRCWRID